jgi:hypothetical protein
LIKTPTERPADHTETGGSPEFSNVHQHVGDILARHCPWKFANVMMLLKLLSFMIAE